MASACGVPIAKHGNRAATSKSGAADVLEALGVNIDLPHFALEHALKEFRFAFLMAPNHHQSMRHVTAVRKEIGERTIFNLLGPLANPAGTRRQLLGVFDEKWILPIAETLKSSVPSGRGSCMARTGWMKYRSLPTHIAILEEDVTIKEKTITPEDFGLKTHNLADIKGGDAQHNAMALRAVLQGERGAYRDIILANTAAVLMIHQDCDDLISGVAKAKDAIDSGFAWDNFCDYIAYSRIAEDTAKDAVEKHNG